MGDSYEKERYDRILTIPNVLSFFRLCLIPLFVWLYCIRQNFFWTAAVLALSGLTDVADGYIARRFNMVSALGKILDPVADKLTQGAMLFCLLTRFPFMALLLILFVMKEAFDAVTGILVVKKTKQVYGAEWHGKATTSMLYGMMFVHLVWYDIPVWISDFLTCLCIGMMMFSLFLYGRRNLAILVGNRNGEGGT